MSPSVSRRTVLQGAGALVVGFSLSTARAQTETGKGGGARHGLPGSLDDTPLLHAWIRIDPTGGGHGPDRQG